ncbi:hypothetical protein RDI58_024825 [Solanum bulbocastanum]|uniref:TF-B3 domain-containing protein n=1 Tax=Solanum bulbocastanum TaxID=147425 RepID=A0AAN8Y3T5_SOLBU
MATVCNYNGSLAIRQGWDKFSADHDLKVGEFLFFHYVPDDRHFIVQMFGTSGCEKINFGSNIGKRKQNERTDLETTTPLLQITSGAHLDVGIDSEAPLPKDDKSKEASQSGKLSVHNKVLGLFCFCCVVLY